jgi:DNA helicase-2/ATP-dependent DNA helicase PcrA
VLELFPEVRERYQTAFRHVLVDEYQDTNHAQYRMLQLLTGVGTGDDATRGTGTSASWAMKISRFTCSAEPTFAIFWTSPMTT